MTPYFSAPGDTTNIKNRKKKMYTYNRQPDVVHDHPKHPPSQGYLKGKPFLKWTKIEQVFSGHKQLVETPIGKWRSPRGSLFWGENVTTLQKYVRPLRSFQAFHVRKICFRETSVTPTVINECTWVHIVFVAARARLPEYTKAMSRGLHTCMHINAGMWQ